MDESEPRADLVVVNAGEVITCLPGGDYRLGMIADGIVAVAGERIVGVGTSDEVARRVDLSGATPLDAGGGIVAPGFVDAHTHVVFGGSRVEEYAAIVGGSLERFRASHTTGILATVEMTRAATVEELTDSAAARIEAMALHGTTTVESKTGYGLTPEYELKMLEVNRRLDEAVAVDVISTFLGAHAIPEGMTAGRYTDQVVAEMIPHVAEAGLADFCDVYSAEQSRRILEAGLDAGLAAKIHADAYSDHGGARLAAELGAVSADHLNHTGRGDMEALAECGVVGVLMPGLDVAVAHPRPFDARAMIDAGMTIALATDLCPGCWLESQQLVMALAARLYGIPADEALLAVTVGGARALALDDRGALAPGLLADLQIWDAGTHLDLVYKLGRNAVVTVVKRGRVQVMEPVEAMT